ncbi:hypothetical protein V6N11_083236 [Hibiscus sabdariffa]|uniref:Uncharacterized protein n=1 Tax=Hibiscus sabdariffa TaxID=183260 RepID=A0ABR2QLB0_9ROSI
MSMGMGEDDLMNPRVEVFATIKDIELAELFRFFSFFPDYLLALAMKQTVKIYDIEAPKGEVPLLQKYIVIESREISSGKLIACHFQWGSVKKMLDATFLYHMDTSTWSVGGV